jgi:hypothetical protein
MITSLSSTVSSPFRYVFPGQGDFSENPKLAFASLLTSYGLPQADQFVEHLYGYVKGNYISLLKLLVMLDSPGISQAMSLLQLSLGQDYLQLQKELEYVLPITANVDYQSTFDVVVDQGLNTVLTSYFDYEPILNDKIFDLEYLFEWISKADPRLANEVAYLAANDLLFFLIALISRITKTELVKSKSSVKKLSICLARTLSLAALGDNPNQDIYFPYVSVIAARS